MFTCPNCKSETKTLIAGSAGIGCYLCVSRSKRDSVNMHDKAGCQGEAKNLTRLDKKHFFNRGLGSDGKTCVCRDNPNKRWNW